MMPAPVKVGIVGLSAPQGDGYTSGGWGLQHFNSLMSSPLYKVTAVCNSSVESASRTIDGHKIADAKPYGSAEDIAADPNVDLVTISVHVDRHIPFIKAAIKHKKDIFIEFPIAPSAADVEELMTLVKEASVKTCIGAQARADPGFKKVRELVRTKVVGNVVFSTMTGHTPLVATDGWPAKQSFFLDIASGASRLRVTLGHTLDVFTNVLGGFSQVQSVFKTVEKKAKLFNDKFTAITDPAYSVTAPDTMLIQGILENGATASVTLRTTRTPVDDIAFRWLIVGTKGEIELTSKPGPTVQFGLMNPRVRVRKWGVEPEDVHLDTSEPEHVVKVLAPGTNTARLYEAFATGDHESFETIEEALETHKLLEKVTKEAIWAQ